jgi:hypothetical protein
MTFGNSSIDRSVDETLHRWRVAGISGSASSSKLKNEKTMRDIFWAGEASSEFTHRNNWVELQLEACVTSVTAESSVAELHWRPIGQISSTR